MRYTSDLIQFYCVTFVFAGCMNDVRYDNAWFPLSTDDSTSTQVAVTAAVNVSDGCVSNACLGVTCPSGQSCRDLWRAWECV